MTRLPLLVLALAASALAESPAPAGDDFTFRLFQAVSQSARGNLVLSPENAREALGLGLLGAKGPTASELAGVLGLPAEPEQLAIQVQQEAQAWVTARGEATLDAAGALWPDTSYPLRADYVARAKIAYGAAPEVLALVEEPKASSERINAWASEKTHGLIPTIVSPALLRKDTQILLTSAVYFKGLWEAPFSASATGSEDFQAFRAHDGRFGAERVPMMKQRHLLRYAANDRLQAVELPYRGSHLAMLVLLPRAAAGLPQLEGTLDATVAGLRLRPADLDLWLPRFQFSALSDLKEPLRQLGLRTTFSDSADFSGLSDATRSHPTKLDAVIQEARVQADEEGTVAAAVTAVRGVRALAVRRPPLPFHVDHPFLFLIRDTITGRVLFVGRVADPGAS